ncbi:sulfatase [Draconibacterium sp.]|nr:sulfatase [Draconibacterium sp.]
MKSIFKPGLYITKQNYRIGATIILFFVAVLFLLSCTNNKSKKAEAQPVPPNVLFIAVDDLNNWLGCMNGHPNAKTPNMDKLASQGVLFTNAHCQAPLCGPSRASLMTGLRPSTTGIYGMIDDNKIRTDNEVTKDILYLPEYFRNNGYHTLGIGKLFHTHAPDGVFDESGGRYKGFGPLPKERFVWDGYGTSERGKYGRTSTDWGAFPEADSLMPDHQSADWTIERLNRDYDKPFFLGVGFLRPHVPLYVPQKWFDMHPLEGLEMTPYKADDLDDVPPVALKINDLPMMPSTDWAIKTGNWAKIIQAYLACVSFVDYEVGRVLDALQNSKYAKNTIVVLWSDHGYRLGEKGTFAKHALWEEATNAPLIFAGPKLPKGKVINVPTEMLSIYPTLLDLCGLPAYDRNEGLDLVTLMMGKEQKAPLAITTFGMNNHGLRTPNYRYIRYEDGGEELYDHTNDPNEWTNLAGNPEYLPIKTDLQNRLPEINSKWNIHSSYTFQPYFVEQKERTSKE